MLHGFPTSSWDFAEAATRLGRRAVLFDFLGFGLSDKPHDFGYSLFEQADLATLGAREYGLGRVHSWAHDMGTSVATMLLARRERDLLPFELASVMLMNGSVHLEHAQPTIGQRILMSPAGPLFAQASGRPLFHAQMRLIFAKPPPDVTLGHMWDLLERCNGVRRLPSIIRYIEERVRFQRRWVGALEGLDLPMLAAWAAKDPVPKSAIAERIAKNALNADLVSWDDLGHYPHQVEVSPRVAAASASFVARFDG